LALIYRAKGLSPDEAEALSTRILADKTVALETLAREELGLNPEELGRPYHVAGSSFTAFAAGAVIPVIPFLFGDGNLNFALSATLSGIALFAVGVAVSLFTGRSWLMSGARQLAIGAVAATVTYTIGRLIGSAPPTQRCHTVDHHPHLSPTPSVPPFLCVEIVPAHFASHDAHNR
jgi:VIT1/CCC1 family predicted Fe2+/Mn2+ transporter